MLVARDFPEVGLDGAPDLAGADELDDGVDVGREVAVPVHVGHDVAHELVHGHEWLCGLGAVAEVLEEVHCLHGAHDFDGDHRLHVPDHLQALARSPAAHRHVVLLRARRGQRVRRARITQRLVLRRQRSRSAVRNHEPRVESAVDDEECRQLAEVGVHQTLDAALGDVGQLLDADGEVVAHLRGILPVEVATAQQAVILGEHHGVVGGTVDLSVENAGDELDGVVCDAVHLRHAAEGVGVLHGAAGHVALCNLRRVGLAVEESPQACGSLALARVRARSMDLRVERRR
mmetsp:Transcript_1111/g.3986  ORF Transcript_1111/g.3986 Transcript_1111/m.3986 type:complete len:289 (-) Transcript_1111:759-1625(-)